MRVWASENEKSLLKNQKKKERKKERKINIMFY
jgi:hypothetical protein